MNTKDAIAATAAWVALKQPSWSLSASPRWAFRAMTRILTALVLIPLIVWVVLAGPQWALLAIMALVGLIAFHEFDTIAGAQGIAKSGWAGIAAGLILLFAPEPAWVAIVIIAVGLMTLELRQTDLAKAMTGAATALLGVVYIFGAWRCAIALRAIESALADDRAAGELGGRYRGAVCRALNRPP